MKLACFSDIHGNLIAFKAALADAMMRGARRFLVAGDAVTDYPQSAEILDLIQREEMQMVLGNREIYCLNYHADDAKREEAFAYPQNRPLKFTYDRLSDDHFVYMESLPHELVIDLGGKRLRVCHHSPGKKHWHLHPTINEEHVVTVMESIDEDILVVGHHHEGAAKMYGDKLFFNPGSVGVNWSGAFIADYGMLEYDDGKLTYTLHHVPYDGGMLLRVCNQSGLMDEPACAFWTWINLKMQTAGADAFNGFFALASEIKKTRGCDSPYIPQDIWDEAAAIHKQKYE